MTSASNEWTEDQLAYDGSTDPRPQSRELTPLERDILVRIITGWWHTVLTIDAEQNGYVAEAPQVEFGKHITEVELWGGLKLIRDELIDDPRVAWMRMRAPEAQLLLDLRQVLSPRRDEYDDDDQQDQEITDDPHNA